MTKINSENNVPLNPNVYVIPYNRPYVVPQKRTAVEQRVMDVMNFGKYLKNKAD